MKTEELMELYQKEREYQQKVFGDYGNNPSLNIASFINFIENYLEKAKKSYSEPWTHQDDFPTWLLTCKENKNQIMSPVKTYEYLVKVMALTGAALEAFSEINVEAWREEDKIHDKWKK